MVSYCFPAPAPCCAPQVLQEEAPLPPAGQYSEEFRDFVRVCLQKDPHKRPMAEQLLTHPFITKVCTDALPMGALAWLSE